MMVSNKSRLYVTLDARNVLGTYHWALAIAPKNKYGYTPAKATRYHVRNIIQDGNEIWEYDYKPATEGSQWTLAGICVAKIPRNDVPKVEQILGQVPLLQSTPGWTCRCWVKDAIKALNDQGEFAVDVEDIERVALWYVQKKVSEGRYKSDYVGSNERIPTWDWRKGKELQT
jgi:hypothetical protein